MFALARARLFLARHRLLRWAVVLTVAAVAASGAATALARVDAARRAWGDTHDVWVATGDIQPGDALQVARRRVPLAMIPPGAATEVTAGATARQYLGRGEIVTTVDLARADWVPPGMVAVAVPVEIGSPPAVGEDVAVFAAGEAVAGGWVVAVAEGWVEIAVDADDAPAVSAAAVARQVVVGRTAGPSPADP